MTQSQEPPQEPRNEITGTEKSLSNAEEEINFSLDEQTTSQQMSYVPLSTPSVFWRPRHVTRSAMLMHVPYLFWLMEVVRPTTVLQIGLDDGLAYMTLCQAVERTGLKTSVLGVPNFDDAQAEARLPEPFHARHEIEYSDFSSLTQQDLASISEGYPHGLDMLVLNTYLDPLMVHGLAEHIVPLLTDKGVILICHPQECRNDARAFYSHVSLANRKCVCGKRSPGRGELDVVLYGQRQPERLLSLGDEVADNSVRMVARQVFGRLGQGLVDALEVEEMQRSLDKEAYSHRVAREEAKALTAVCAHESSLCKLTEETNDAVSKRLANVITTYNAELSQLEGLLAERQSLLGIQEERLSEIAALTEKCRLAYKEIAACQKAARAAESLAAERLEKVDALTREVEALRIAAETHDTELNQKLEEKTNTLEKSQTEWTELNNRYQQRLEDIAILSNEFSQKHTKQEERIRGLEEELANTRHALSAATWDQSRLRSEVEALLSSTSWQITRPLRVIKQLLDGNDNQGN